MSAAVFLLDPLPAGPLVRLDGPEGRHAATVRRLRVGEALVLTDGRGSRRNGRVVAARRDELDVDCEPIEFVPPPDPRLVVVQAVPKGERAELALELLTELGADEIVPWLAQRGIVQWRGEREVKSVARWRRTVQEAGKQTRRARFPVVTDPRDTAGVAVLVAGASTALVLHEDATRPLVTVELAGHGDIVVIVGPEGGITADEIATFTAAGADVVRLGEPVLRTSTAGGAALAVLSARLGRWSR